MKEEKTGKSPKKKSSGKERGLTPEELEAEKALKDYHEAIKKKLCQWRTKQENENLMEIDFPMLVQRMQQYGVYTSEQKLKAMFALGNDRKIQLAEIVALCELLRFPLGDICALQRKPDETDFRYPWLKKKSDGTAAKIGEITALTDVHYHHEYHCVYFRTRYHSPLELGGRKPAQAIPLKMVKLKIFMENGTSQAILTDEYGFQISGRVFLIERSRQIFVRLLDAKGLRFIHLLLPYRNYSVDPMYYRTAGMMTISYNDREAPLFQKMAMFRMKPDLRDLATESLIRGILTLDSREIMIEEEDFEALIQEDEAFAELKDFVKPKQYYVFREEDFANPKLSWNREERIRKLLHLRQMSELSAHEIVSDSEDLAKFLKEIQESKKEER